MKRIFLIGFMGSGKTTLGKALSRQLGIDFIDLDLYIEARYHKTIREIFAESGEERFRQIEKSLLHEVADFENVIIAAGGGTPCFFDNIDYMNSRGPVVYLKATPEVLRNHLLMGKTERPLIKGKTPSELAAFITAQLEQREPFYAKAAYTFDVNLLDTYDKIGMAVEGIRKMLGV